MLRVDNPAVDVRAARIDGGGFDDPSDLRAVLADATARRPDGGPCAVVIPLIATVNPPVIRRLREAVAASGTNAIVSGFINSNAMIAEVLHIRLAEAGLARADRVRLFSIVTAADGVLIATVGGPDAAGAANVTSVLLAARLALPVITASADSVPSVQEGAMRLKEMGVNRLAIAPCFIGPEATGATWTRLRDWRGVRGPHRRAQQHRQARRADVRASDQQAGYPLPGQPGNARRARVRIATSRLLIPPGISPAYPANQRCWRSVLDGKIKK